MQFVNVYRRSSKLLDLESDRRSNREQQPYGPHHPLLETGEAFPCAIVKKPKCINGWCAVYTAAY